VYIAKCLEKNSKPNLQIMVEINDNPNPAYLSYDARTNNKFNIINFYSNYVYFSLKSIN
jgi:hypothetical protein